MSAPPVPPVAQPLRDQFLRLADAAGRFAVTDASGRAEIARRVAMATAAVADTWAETAVAVKRGSLDRGPSLAEEIATGPMATARLCLLIARAQLDIAAGRLPRTASPPRCVVPADPAVGPLVAVDVLPAQGPSGTLHDGSIHQGLQATVRCRDPGGLAAFAAAWRREVEERPASGGVAVVLGAGNVTALAPADVLTQVFEHGRAVFLKLHPLQAPLEPVLRGALGPLVGAGLLAIGHGGAELARAAIAAPEVTHVHVTGGRAAYDAIRRAAGSDAEGLRGGGKPISCELGNVTPWFVLPARYSRRVLAHQADLIAASIVNNTSFNCIATKVVVTCRGWEQREALLALVRRRLGSVAARPAWYPGAVTTWTEATGRAAPADGTLPWHFAEGVDPAADDRLVGREWFAPVVAEVPLDADDLAGFRSAALDLVGRLPGSLAASVTIPAGLSAADRRHAEALVDALPFGVVAVNGWSAFGYALGNVPWGGFPGATAAEPRSGIGFVHDPLLLPGVRNSIVRGPLWTPLRPPWLPWHRAGARLARGLVTLYGLRAEGRSGMGMMLRMLPDVLTG